jgi:hypothetical protein
MYDMTGKWSKQIPVMENQMCQLQQIKFFREFIY